MSNLKAGDVCIYVGPIREEAIIGHLNTGDEVTIVERMYFEDEAEEWGWLIDFETEEHRFWAAEKYLRKRDDKPFTSWFNEHIIVDPIAPLTEPLAREQLRGLLQPFDNFFERAP